MRWSLSQKSWAALSQILPLKIDHVQGFPTHVVTFQTIEHSFLAVRTIVLTSLPLENTMIAVPEEAGSRVKLQLCLTNYQQSKWLSHSLRWFSVDFRQSQAVLSRIHEVSGGSHSISYSLRWFSGVDHRSQVLIVATLIVSSVCCRAERRDGGHVGLCHCTQATITCLIRSYDSGTHAFVAIWSSQLWDRVISFLLGFMACPASAEPRCRLEVS